MGEYSADHDNHTQLQQRSTHKIRDNYGENSGVLCVAEQEVTFDWKAWQTTLPLQGIRPFAGSQQKFCNVCGPQPRTSTDLGTVDIAQS